jgi:DNA-binding GntR family transcriptional regulator
MSGTAPQSAAGPAPPPQLGERIYQGLRWSLVTGGLEPGETLSIRSLASAEGTSAMPVREALKRLEAEGALSGAPKRAYRVAEMSPGRAADLFQVQSVLEGAAAEAAAGRLAPGRIARLRELTRQMDQAMAAEDSRAYLTANYRFHRVIHLGSGNGELAAMLETLYARTGPWLGRAIRRFSRIEDWRNQHLQIAEALAARDGAAARSLVEDDISWTSALYRRIMVGTDRTEAKGRETEI